MLLFFQEVILITTKSYYYIWIRVTISRRLIQALFEIDFFFQSFVHVCIACDCHTHPSNLIDIVYVWTVLFTVMIKQLYWVVSLIDIQIINSFWCKNRNIRSNETWNPGTLYAWLHPHSTPPPPRFSLVPTLYIYFQRCTNLQEENKKWRFFADYQSFIFLFSNYVYHSSTIYHI